MGTLIGNGGHAQDILCASSEIWSDVLDHHGEYDRHREYKRPFIIAINDPQIRARVAAELDIQDDSWMHPDARIYPGSRIGYGTHINYGAMMTRTTIGDHCTIGPGVHMAGDIIIGDRVFIGIGAIIGNLVTVGDDAIIGAGSVVLKDVPAGQKILGVWA